MREITSINFMLTTHCNMACPDCCAGITAMAKEKRKFMTWTEVKEAAKYLYGINRINLTGGEPTIHPKFSEWVPKLKETFGAKVLSVWTNGTMFQKKKDAFKHFDEIHITNYTKDTFEGSPDNTHLIEFIKEYLKDYPVKISDYKAVHTPLTQRGTKMCFRGYSDTVEYLDGYVYPCSSSSGLPTQVKVKLTENWKDEVLKIHPPCHECLFAE
jgi:MoaA/NifB/PqqE/SkfB family radical SAM enzyme